MLLGLKRSFPNLCRSFPLLAFAFLILFSFSTAAALEDRSRYGARIWQTDDGLPQTHVQAVLQTRDQYLWIGTQKGLTRFDGVRFTIFNPENTPGLRGDLITALCESRDGSLWIGTSDGGLTRLNAGIFSHFGTKEGLSSEYVKIIFEASDGVLWIGTRDGLLQFSHGVFSDSPSKLLVPGTTVRALTEDGAGNVWVGTDRGLVRFKNGRGEFFTALSTKDGMLNDSVRALYWDRAGNLWIGSNDGLTKLKDGVFSNYGKKDKWVNTLFEDSMGNLWVGSYSGLSRFSDGRLIPELNSEGMSYDNVNSILEDKEGNIWVGSKEGLSRLRRKPFTAFTEQQGLTHNNVMSIFEDLSGSLWIGTWGGGLNELKEGKFLRHIVQDKKESPLILAIHPDHEGNLWIGTDFDGGLFHYKDNTFTRYGRDEGLTDFAIKVIHEDQHRNVWLGTRSALVCFKDGKFTRYTTKAGLSGDMIKVICEDHAGDLWFGTDGGLSKWNHGTFVSFTTAEGLSANSVSALREDSDHVLWIGTEGGGLNCFRDGKFRSYTKKEGLFSDEVFEILEDDHGYFWMSCQKGIFRCAKKDFAAFDAGKIKALTSISYGKADGLVSTVCNGVAKPAGLKTRDGRLWFATTKGIVVVDPNSNIKINETPPPVFIEKVIADKMAVPRLESTVRNQDGSGRPSAVNLESALTIEPGRGELEFHYTALSFQAPEKNRFKYKLDGVDLEWMDAGGRREAYYNNIGPGGYRFHVRACNNDGFWNDTGASLAVVMLPHYWQTWWFKLSLVTAVGLVFALIYRIRIERARELERLRLRIAADLHDEVGSNLGSISLLSRMLQEQSSATDEAKRDLSLINRISGETANAIKDIVWFINPEYDTMQDLLLRMEDVANTLLGGIPCEFQSRIESPARKLSLDFRQNIFLIFKEALANILKHSRATKVFIQVSEKNGVWTLSLKDNGSGFDASLLSHGNGLKNFRRRAAAIHGNLEIKTQPGQGTELLFTTESF